MTFDVATVKIDVVKKRRDAVMKKDLLFPKMEAFSLTVWHNEPLFDTQEDAVLLLAEEKTEVILSRRVYTLSRGDALLALPYSYLRSLREKNPFYGYAITFPKELLHTLCGDLYLNRALDVCALSFPPQAAHRLLDTASALFRKETAPVYALPAIFCILENEALSETQASLEVPLPKVLRRALAYIEESAPTEPSATELAERYGVSQSTVNRLFRSFLATTPHKYAQALRQLHERKNGVD